MEKFAVGSLAWARQSGGALSLADRFRLMARTMAPALSAVGKTWLRIGERKSCDFSSIPQPDTDAIRSAYALLESCASPSIINHSFRTYFWGAAFARFSGVHHDPELLMASCLLHDLGMTDAHCGKLPGCACFAVEGALAAEEWARGIGWPPARQQQIAEAISLHLNGDVAVSQGAEAHLLQQGAACDVVGSRFYEMDSGYRGRVLEQHPRLGFKKVMLDFATGESRRRPQSRTRLIMQSGFGVMIKASPFSE